MNMQSARWLVATFVVLAIGGYLLSRNPASLGPAAVPFSGTVHRLVAEQGCDIRGQACAASGEGRAFSLAIPADVRPLRPFDVRVVVPPGLDYTPSRVLVEFEMLGMDMGVNRYRLERYADGSWQGKAVLPVCSTGRTDWIATVSVMGAGEMWTSDFSFVAEPVDLYQE